MDYTGLGSLAVAAVALLLSIYNTGKKATKDDTMQLAMVMAKLDTVGEDIRDMRKDMTDMRQKVDDSHDKVIILERDLKTMWNRIDELKIKVDGIRHGGGAT